MNPKISASVFDSVRTMLGSRLLVRDTITTTVFSVLGRGVGFLIPFFIAAWYGIGPETDAFFFAYGLILFLATIFSPVVESIIVPFVAEARANGEDVGAFVGRVLGASAIGLSAVTLAFVLIVRPVLTVLTRFTPEGLDTISIVLLESAPLVVLLVWSSVLAGVFNAYRYFAIPALSPAMRAVVTVSFIFAFKDVLGIHAVALGYVAGELFRLCVLYFLSGRLGLFRVKLSLGWDAHFGEFVKTSSYQVAAMSAVASTPIINKALASWLGPGKVSIIEYADRLYMIPLVFIRTGLITAMLSHWSARYQTDGDERLKRDVLKATKIVGVAALILTAILFLAKGHVVRLAYGHGEFPEGRLADVATIFGCYLMGFAAHILSQVYSKAHMVRKDTKYILYTTFISLTSGIVLALILMQFMGVVGIALASSASAFITMTFMAMFFYRKRSA